MQVNHSLLCYSYSYLYVTGTAGIAVLCRSKIFEAFHIFDCSPLIWMLQSVSEVFTSKLSFLPASFTACARLSIPSLEDSISAVSSAYLRFEMFLPPNLCHSAQHLLPSSHFLCMLRKGMFFFSSLPLRGVYSIFKTVT